MVPTPEQEASIKISRLEKSHVESKDHSWDFDLVAKSMLCKENFNIQWSVISRQWHKVVRINAIMQWAGMISTYCHLVFCCDQ